MFEGRVFLDGAGAALSPCSIFSSIEFFQGVTVFVGILFGLPFRGHALDELFGHPHLGFSEQIFQPDL